MAVMTSSVTNAEFASVDDMDPARLRHIFAIYVDTLPLAVPLGMADWLINGALEAGIEEMFAQKRTEWVRAHSYLAEVDDFALPLRPTNSFSDYLTTRVAKNRIRSELDPNAIKAFSASSDACGTRIVLYQAAKGIELNRITYVATQQRNTPTPRLFSPISVAVALDTERLDRWKDKRIYFLSGFRTTGAMFLRVKREGEDGWNIGEITPDMYTSIEEGSIVVFRDQIF